MHSGFSPPTWSVTSDWFSLSLSSWDDWQADPHLQPYQTGRHHQGAHWDHLWSCCAVSLLSFFRFFSTVLPSFSDSPPWLIIFLPHSAQLFWPFFFFFKTTSLFLKIPSQSSMSIKFCKSCHILWWLILLSDLICSSSPSADVRNWGLF